MSEVEPEFQLVLAMHLDFFLVQFCSKQSLNFNVFIQWNEAEYRNVSSLNSDMTGLLISL